MLTLIHSLMNVLFYLNTFVIVKTCPSHSNLDISKTSSVRVLINLGWHGLIGQTHWNRICDYLKIRCKYDISRKRTFVRCENMLFHSNLDISKTLSIKGLDKFVVARFDTPNPSKSYMRLPKYVMGVKKAMHMSLWQWNKAKYGCKDIIKQ